MAAIDHIWTSSWYDKMDLVLWALDHNPSLLKDIANPFESWESWVLRKQGYAERKGITNEEDIDNIKFIIACFDSKQDKYLYWHCPLDFVREYLENQCGYKKANWFVKLFWKY